MAMQVREKNAKREREREREREKEKERERIDTDIATTRETRGKTAGVTGEEEKDGKGKASELTDKIYTRKSNEQFLL